MIKICFLTKYHKNGASSRYRYFNYEEFLDKDILVDYNPLLSFEYVENFNIGRKNSVFKIAYDYIKRIIFLIFHANKYDLLIIEKELFPYIPYFIEKILLFNKNYTLDYDDNAKTKYEKKFFLKNKINQLVKDASFITVGNKWYFDDFSFKKDIFLLPTVVDFNKYNYTIDSKITKHSIFSIVWIGSRSTTIYLQQLEKPLNNLFEKGINFQLILIGAGKFKFQNAKFNYKIIDWSEKTEALELKRCHLGIMPLYTTNWDEGKCGFKLIQYLAAGLPIIASDTIANYEIVKKSQVGKIALNDDDWEKYICYFYENKDNYNEYNYLATSCVKKYYCYQVTAKNYSKLLKKYAGVKENE